MVFNFDDPRGCAPTSMSNQKQTTLVEELLGGLDDCDPEETKVKLQQKLAHKTTEKQNKVPKTGKGKYNLTVPVLFPFQKHPRQKMTLQEWIEIEKEK